MFSRFVHYFGQQRLHLHLKPNRFRNLLLQCNERSYSSSRSKYLNALSTSHYIVGGILASTITSATLLNNEMEKSELLQGVNLARRNSLRKQRRHYPYVVIGAGTTAYAAVEAIRQHNPTADILILSEDPILPRMDIEKQEETLSDSLLDTYNEWRRHISSNLRHEPDAYSSSPVTLVLGKNDMHLDVENHEILLPDGSFVHFDKCLIATAGQPRNFYILDSNKISYALKDRINTCTTINDFAKLDVLHKIPDLNNVTVVGGGFLGTEVACSLACNPKYSNIKIQQVFVESNPVDRYLPEYLSRHLRQKLQNVGVEINSDRLVTGIKSLNDDEQNRELVVSLLGFEKQKLPTDYVVLCSTHIDPKVYIASQSGLEIDSKNGGIVVNSQFEAVSGVFVAGNAASYYDIHLGRRRLDMYDHAVNSGLLAGQNMVAEFGKTKLYTHQPMFRSSLPGIGILMEGVGEINANLSTVGVWLENPLKGDSKQPNKYDRGIIYYLRGTQIVGILLWNASDLLESARQLINFHSNVSKMSDLKKTLSIGPDHWLNVIPWMQKNNAQHDNHSEFNIANNLTKD